MGNQGQGGEHHAHPGLWGTWHMGRPQLCAGFSALTRPCSSGTGLPHIWPGMVAATRLKSAWFTREMGEVEAETVPSASAEHLRVCPAAIQQQSQDPIFWLVRLLCRAACANTLSALRSVHNTQ